METKIPVFTNLVLALFFFAANIFQFILLPLVLLDHSIYYGLILIPLVFSTTTYWALMHEGVHGVLFPGKIINNLVSRIFSITFGSPFDILRFGHMMHHRYNRTNLDQSEVFTEDRAPLLFSSSYYFRILNGLYLAELASNLMVFLPLPILHRIAKAQFSKEEESKRLLEIIQRQLLNSATVWTMRLEAILIFALFSVSFWLYGSLWFLLVAALVGRGFMISFFDNAYHYRTPLYEVHYSYNLRLPQPVSKLILHFNLHRVHHRHPNLSWIQLPDQFKENDGVLDGGYFEMAFKQLKGPVHNSELT